MDEQFIELERLLERLLDENELRDFGRLLDELSMDLEGFFECDGLLDRERLWYEQLIVLERFLERLLDFNGLRDRKRLLDELDILNDEFLVGFESCTFSFPLPFTGNTDWVSIGTFMLRFLSFSA